LSNADPALRDILSKLLDTREELCEGLGLYWDENGQEKDTKAIEYMYKSIRDTAKLWLPVNSQNTDVFTDIFYKVEEEAVASLTDTLKRLEQELMNALVCKPEYEERERPSYEPTKCAVGRTAENGFCFQFSDCDCASINETHRHFYVGSTMGRFKCQEPTSQQACIDFSNKNGNLCIWRGPSSNAGLLERSLENKRQSAPVPEPDEPQQDPQDIYFNAAPRATCRQNHDRIKGKCYKRCPSEWKEMARSRGRCERDCPLSNPFRGDAGAVRDVCARTTSALDKASNMQMVKGIELFRNVVSFRINIIQYLSGNMQNQKNELKIDDGAVINLDLLKNALESAVAFAKSFFFPRCTHSG